MTLCFQVFPGDNPLDNGSVLVWTDSRNHARLMAANSGPWLDVDYLDMRARRVAHLDRPDEDLYYMAETNDGLPDGIEDFWEAQP